MRVSKIAEILPQIKQITQIITKSQHYHIITLPHYHITTLAYLDILKVSPFEK